MGDLTVHTVSPATVSRMETDTKFEKISIGQHSLVAVEPTVLWKKGGRLLSGLLGLNVLLLAIVLISSAAFNDVALVEWQLLSLLCTLMGLTGCWMAVYLLWTSKKDHHTGLKDSHAGPIWLRVGLAVFGVCTLLLDVLKIGKAVGLVQCASPIQIIQPIFQFVFVVLQTYFLWVSCRNCVQSHMNLTRCGLMLTLSTNLAIWMAAVTDESLHQTPSANSSSGGHRMSRAGGGSDTCACNNLACETFETGYYYLYPFNIEYSLFASAMSYVMWKNVGRVMSQHSHHTHHSLCPHRLFVGLICGVAVLVAGLGVFIVYEIDVSSDESRPQALEMFYIFNIIALSLMCISSLAGTIIFRFDKREADSHKNPTRNLDVGLLIIAALGKYCIAYFSIIAIIAKSPGGLIDHLNLVYSLLMILQHTLQNIFIIEGLHREPFSSGHSGHRSSVAYNERHEVYINQADAGIQSNHLEAEHGHELDSNSNGVMAYSMIKNAREDLRRKALKEICLFLLISNIIFWIMPAFGARPEFDNKMEMSFYGNAMWPAIVNIGLPFGIFYRMHSVASLLEVYVIS
ncbi:proton channel OTOP2-like [Bufo gargarizans]|uniref:proton channel OTOP2-like n=1 Tax=Bufo gargarizans TaxID=30331 RepID=UPI001CF295B0|nr:proton channel OTOP2-like [Bufo gargarizans]